MDQPAQKRSPWVYVGCGCGALVLLSILGVVLVGYVIKDKVEGFTADMKDPAARTARAKQILNAQALPPGYFASISVSVPMVMDMALLSDKAPDASGEIKGFDKRGFLYFKVISPDKDRDKLRDYFEGKSDDAGSLKKATVNMDVRETLKRGALDLAGKKLLYVANRGDTDTGQGKAKGLQTMMLFDCSTDQKMRVGIWFGEDPSPTAPAKDLDLKGTVADEASMRAFVSNFDPCGA